MLDDVEGFAKLPQFLLRGVVVLRGVLGAGRYDEVMAGLVGFVVVEVVDEFTGTELPTQLALGGLAVGGVRWSVSHWLVQRVNVNVALPDMDVTKGMVFCLLASPCFGHFLSREPMSFIYITMETNPSSNPHFTDQAH